MAPPSTPSGKTHEGVNEYITAIERQWNLGLTIRGETWSPLQGKADHNCHICVESIKYLFWMDKPQLDSVYEAFEKRAAHIRQRQKKLELLIDLLKKNYPTPKSGKGLASPKVLRPQGRIPPPDFTGEARAGAVRDSGEHLNKHLEDMFNRASTMSSNHMTAYATAEDTPPSTPRSAESSDEVYGTPPESPSLDRSIRQQRKRKSFDRTDGMHSPKLSRTSAGKQCIESISQRPRVETEFHDCIEEGYTLPKSPTRSPRSSISTQPDDYGFNSTAQASFQSNVPVVDTAQTSFANNVPNIELSSALAESLDEEMDDLLRKYERAQVVSPGTQSIVQSSTPPVSTRRQEPEHFQVRDLPNQGLFVSSPGAWVNSSSPFRFRYECQRVALVNSLPVEEVAPRYHSRFDDIDTLWAHFKEDNLILPKQPSQQAWGASVGDFREVTLKGSLSINPKNTGSLFKLSLEPLHIDISSRFQRAWGGDRFLYLNVPSFQGLKNHLSGPKQQQHLHNRYHEWLLTEKQFLGRTWRVLLLETKKPKKCGKRDKESAAQRLILFATHGCTLSPAPTAKRNDASIRDLIHWFMPLDKNRDQPYCKAYARLELGFSRTTPAITLKPSQVLYVPDKLPSPKFEEATEFDDHTLWRPYKVDQKNVMNDGCSIMSVGMAIYIWKTMNLPGQIPSAFQGRIGGAKGVWMLSAAVNTADAHHRDIWIEITESQRKFQPHDEDQDRCDATFEPHRLTFDVVAYTKATQSSTLHVAFLPILLDRGIPAKDLKSLMDHYLEAERIDLLEKMRNPVQTRQWISSEFSDITGQHGITWQAGLPEGISQRAKFLLDSGFDPKQLKTLAADMISLVETHLTKLKQSLSLQVSRSTYTMGVADPLGVLQPGEIHLAFSKTFVDEVNQESYQFLKDVDVLVARHPALRRSDIQRVQAVYKIELAHLVDVVVFPSTGSFPLASKLQGGDYDGDTFWLCWEPILTRNFKNAPAPYTSPSPHQYGISVDKRELKSLLGPQHSVDGFLSKVFEFRARRGVLGIATNFHEKVSYWENSIASPGIERLADIHDLLVDSSKNGYTFEESKWREFVNNCEDIVIKAPKEPAYKSAVQWNAQRHSSGPGSMNNQYKKDHIIDQIYFEHVLPKCDEILKDIGIVFENTVESDADLESLYLEENLHADQAINAELAELVKALKDLHAFYVNLVRPRHNFNGSEVERDSYASSIQKCFEKYENISPSRTDDRVIRSWLRKRSKGSFTYWSLLKASALWSKRKENQRFVLSIAGRELAQLKAESDDNFRTVIGAMYANMKPRKFKASPPTEAISKNEDSDYESALEDQGV